MGIKKIDLGGVCAVNESAAVAMGKAVLAALADASEVVLLADTEGDEAVWSEFTAYLSRRGVTVDYNYDAGYMTACVLDV